MNDGEAAKLVANHLRVLAKHMARQRRWGGEHDEVVIEGFLGAAFALANSKPPPPQRQVIALIQILTAGLETLSTDRANDLS